MASEEISFSNILAWGESLDKSGGRQSLPSFDLFALLRLLF